MQPVAPVHGQLGKGGADLDGAVCESDEAGTHQYTNSDYDWWDGVGSMPAGHVSYEGVLVHELGHGFGLGHSGDNNWTYDGSNEPAMADCGSNSETRTTWESVQQDDWGSAVHIGGGWPYFWSANPGIEAGQADWGKSGTVTFGSQSYVFSGSKSVRIRHNGNYAYETQVLDPNIGQGNGLHPHHDAGTSADPIRAYGRAWYITPYSTGELWIGQNKATLTYEADGCKSSSNSDPSGFTGYSIVAKCYKSTAWTVCSGYKEYTDLTNNDDDGEALIIRQRFRNKASNSVFIDAAGIYGGINGL